MDFCAAFLVCGMEIICIKCFLKIIEGNSGGVTVYL